MKKLMLILGLTVIFLCGATAQASFILTDVFNDFNTDLWLDASHDGGWTSVENGYLALGTTEDIHFGRGRANSVFNLSGNFTTNVDFDLVAFPTFYGSSCLYVFATDGSFAMRIGRTYALNDLQYLESSYMVDGNWGGDTFTLNADVAGEFRIARTGNTLSASYFSGTWDFVNSVSPLSTADVFVVLEAGNDGGVGNSPGVEVHHNNFYASADGITGADDYVTAAPEPGTLILLGTGLLGLGAINRIRRKR